MKQKAQKRRDEFWANHIKRWGKSGKSRKQYCQETNISYWTFLEWQKRFQGFKGKVYRKPMVQIPLKIAGMPQDERNTIEMVVNESITIRVKPGFSGELLRSLLEEVGAFK